MSEINKPNHGAKIAPTNSSNDNQDSSSEHLHDHTKDNENGILDGNILDKDKDQELPELIREREGRRGLMSGMPSINLNELTVILRDPNMPSHKIMKEVADKIMLRSEESESDDGSVGSSGGVVGMKGLLDCIFEVTYEHTNSNNSDDEDDECFQRITREIPCNFCNKVFGSTMTWKTHVLVAHQDPSVLNIKQMSTSEDKNVKVNVSHRKHYKASTTKSEDDVKDAEVCQDPIKDDKQIDEPSHEDKNMSFGLKYSSDSRSQHKESNDRHNSLKDQAERMLLPIGKPESLATSSGDPTELNKDETIDGSKHGIAKKVDQCIANDSRESGSKDIFLAEGEKMVGSSASCRSELQDPDQISQEDSLGKMKEQQTEDSLSKMKEQQTEDSLSRMKEQQTEDSLSRMKEQQTEDSLSRMKEQQTEDSLSKMNSSAESVSKAIDLSMNVMGSRKRGRSSPLSEPTSPSSPSSPSSTSKPSLNPKRSRKHVAGESDPKSTQ